VQNPIEVTSLNTPGAVLMHFDLSARNHRIVVDGLGRISAALEIVDVSQNPEFDEELRNELQKILKGFCIPVTFYAPKPGDKPLNQDEMAQLFHDFNFKVVPVPARVAIALDTSDIYIRLTDRVAQSDAIAKHGGMEKRAASLGKKSTALVVQQTLYRFVRGATEGERFQESNREFTGDAPVLTAKSFEDELDKLSRFLGALASNMVSGGRTAPASICHRRVGRRSGSSTMILCMFCRYRTLKRRPVPLRGSTGPGLGRCGRSWFWRGPRTTAPSSLSWVAPAPTTGGS
jgi:hypothetical protein